MTLAGLSPAGALIVRAGEPFALQVGYVDENGDLQDLTGRLFALAIRYTDQTAPLLTINAELDGQAVNAVALGTAEQASQIYAAGVTRSLSYDFMELTGGATASRLTERVAVQPGSEIPGDLVPQYMDLPMLSVTVAAQRKLVVERGRPGFGAERRLYDAGLIDEPTVAAMDERYLTAGAAGAAEAASLAEIARDEAYTARDAAEVARDDSVFARFGFPSRDALLEALPVISLITSDGQSVSAADLSYIRQSGATAIPDLPGWLPAGDVYAGHFGFVGVGTREDTLKLTTSAFAYLHSLGGGTLHFTAGLFRVGNTNSDTTRIGGNWDNQAGLWVKHDNIRLKGAGENVTILQLADGQDAHVLKFGQRVGASIAVKGCGFSDLTIDGNRDNQTAADQDALFCNSGVDISTGCTDFLGERATIKECQWYGIGVQRDDFHNIILRDLTLLRTGSDLVDGKGDGSRNTGNVLEGCRGREWGLAEPETTSAAFDMRCGWLVFNCVCEILPDDPITYARDGFRVQDSGLDPDPTPKQGTVIRDCKGFGGRSKTTTISGNAGVRAKTRWARVSGGEFTGWNHGNDVANPDCFLSEPILLNNYIGAYFWQDSFSEVGAEADQPRIRVVARNNVYGLYLESVDNATIDSALVSNDYNLWISEGCTNTRVNGECFGALVKNFTNLGTGTTLGKVVGITSRSKRLVQIPVGSVGLVIGSITHQLAVTPEPDDVTFSFPSGSTVSDYGLDFWRVASVTDTTINYEVMVAKASATPGGIMNMSLVTRALEF
ncbi:hypothetical protein ACFOOJ_21255 [Sphingobium xenophagum]